MSVAANTVAANTVAAKEAKESERYSVVWRAGQLHLVDQRRLPLAFETISYQDHAAVASAIKEMVVRGAPAIGAAGGYAMALAAINSTATEAAGLLQELEAAKALLDAARPTAVNLTWATARLLEVAATLLGAGAALAAVKAHVLEEAEVLADDDIAINKALGAHGAALIGQGANLLHHCNTGRLATVDYGTALGVIYSCHEQGKDIHVWVDETRPRLQGSRLTAWELMRAKVPMHLIADNAAGLLMYQGKVDAIVFGADRVAANGDTANKIGTYKISVCGRENNIPTYACVPVSTIDLNIPTGKGIPIEEREAKEVLEVQGVPIAPLDCPVFNPAFDVTPAKYITAIITEEGVCYPPFEQSLQAAVARSKERTAKALVARMARYLSSHPKAK